MTPSLARETAVCGFALALCTGLLGLTLGWGIHAWWTHQRTQWYVDIVCAPPPSPLPVEEE